VPELIKAMELVQWIRDEPADKAGTIVYYARQFTDPSILPLAPKDAKDAVKVSADNPIRTFSINSPEGLPSGCMARKTLSYLTTLAVRYKTPKTITASRRQLYSTVTGQAPNGQQQLNAFIQIFIQTITADLYIKEVRTDENEAFELRARAVLSDLSIFSSDSKVTFELSDSFIKLTGLIKPHPVDARALQFLWHNRSPIGIDFYCWVAYRAPSVSYSNPLFLNWEQLQLIFPNEWERVNRPSVFNNRLKTAIKLVNICYPKLNISVSNDGVLIHKSAASVPKIRESS